MDLVVHQVQQLQDVGHADRDRLGVRLAGAPVVQQRLADVVDHLDAVAVGLDRADRLQDLVLARAVEHRGGDVGRARRGSTPSFVKPHSAASPRWASSTWPRFMRRRHTHRVQDDVHRRAVGHEGHVLFGQDRGDDALVAVAPRQLVAVGDLALLGHVDAHQLVHAGRQLVAVVAVEHAHADHLAALAVRHLERGVAHLARLLTEDRAQQPLLGRELGLALGGDLAHQVVPGVDLGPDAHDPALVEVLQDLLGDVGDVAGDLLGAELGVAGVDLVLLDVDRLVRTSSFTRRSDRMIASS